MKKTLFAAGSCILILLAGCSGNPEDAANQIPDSVVSVENMVSGNETSDSGITANGISENMISENETSENETLEDETPETGYQIAEKDIVNLEEALENYWSSFSEMQREIAIEENYVDEVPVELQNFLIYRNDGIDDERDEAWAEYLVECEQITDEAMKETGLDDKMLRALDIDGDGEDEYYHVISNGNSGWSYLGVYKKVEGKWVETYVNNSEGSSRILFYEDTYYLFSQEEITWWNDEVEIPWTLYDTIGDDACWKHLVMWRIPTEYTPYEIYSNVQDESIDYLENIDLDCMEFSDDIEKVEVTPYSYYKWHTDTVSLEIQYGWERSYNEEQYLYVVSERWTSRSIYLESWDKQLLIMHRTEDGAWEIVKVYYLMANYDEGVAVG